jgi:hypothetical protein
MKLGSIFLLIFGLSAQPSTDGWEIFAKVKFTDKFFKELSEYYVIPFSTQGLRKLRSYDPIVP